MTEPQPDRILELPTMSGLRAVTTGESERGFQISHRAAFIEVGYNFLSALKKAGGKTNVGLKSQRGELASVLRAGIGKQGFKIEAGQDFDATVGKVLDKIADDFGLPRESR